jgi:hypothetical protein
VTSAMDATTNKLTNKVSRRNDYPKTNKPIKSPIIIPTTGKTYMYFAMFSKVAFDDGNIVRNEKTDPISLSMNPPPNK